MVDERLLSKVHSLSDLELAALLSLIAREHCLISTPSSAVEELIEELRLVARKTFRLNPVVVSCTPHTTLDDFTSALLVLPAASPTTTTARSISPYRSRNDGGYFLSQPGGSTSLRPSPYSAATSPTSPSQLHVPHIANVVLAKHLNLAPKAVQIQALELLRTRRIFTRTAVHSAPKQFLFVAVVEAASGGLAHVTPHLNEFFYISHWHDPEDGFANLDEEWGTNGGKDDDDAEDGASTTSSESVVRRGSGLGSSFTADGRMSLPRPDGGKSDEPMFTEGDIACLAQLGQQVHVDVDVLRYQMNIVSFLRLHRAVSGGVSPAATKHFEQLMKSLAPLHGLDYTTPALVALAAKKVYLHRLKMVAPERERSMQWGSELTAVEAVLEELGPEEVIDDVLGMVAAPQ